MTQSAAPAISRNGFGVTALVLAMLGLLVSLVPATRFVALILGLLAVLFGSLGWSRVRQGVATNRVMIVIGTVLGIGAAALGVWGLGIVLGAVDPPGNDSPGAGRASTAVADAAILSCSRSIENGVSSAYATVRITNSTDRAQTYLATIAVNDVSGARIGRINVVGNSLLAGQSVTVSGMDAHGTTVGAARPGPASCVVASVNRVPNTITCPPGEVDAKLC